MKFDPSTAREMDRGAAAFDPDSVVEFDPDSAQEFDASSALPEQAPGGPDSTQSASTGSPTPRRGSLRTVRPFVAGDERLPPPPKDRSVLDQPHRTEVDFAQDSRQARAVSDRAAQIRQQPKPQSIGPASPAQSMAMDIANTSNPVARGALAGTSNLGKVGTGAVRLLADIAGAESVEQFARGAAGVGSTLERGAAEGLTGNDKLIADVTSSILNSAPSLALGLAGGPALRGLFVQSTLQEYNAGRDAGFDTGESLARAGIMGTAEALGERFGFPEQIQLLKAATRTLPQGELAKVVGNLLVKEIPGEQVTTAIQFLADKVGPAALAPDATLEDYLNAAGETLKVTLGQMAVMGGGPAAVVTARNNYRRTDAMASALDADPAVAAVAASPYGSARAVGFHVDPPMATDSPQAQRKKTEEVFAGVAAMYGLPAKIVQAAREAAEGRPLRDLGAFYGRYIAALQRRGAVPQDIAPEIIAALSHGSVQPAGPTQADTAGVADEAIDAADVIDGEVAEASAPQAGPMGAVAPSAASQHEAVAAIEDQVRSAGTLEDGAGAAEAAAVTRIEQILRDAGAMPAQTDSAHIDPSTAVEVPTPIDTAANDAATSPFNDRPEPSDAQKEAGNYAKGHVRISGLDVSIENPKGSMRRSKADAAEPWEVEMPARYGYIRGTKGADGDHVDLFVGDAGDNGRFWVVNQLAANGKAFDEHKVITGVDSAEQAVEVYKASFADGFGDRVFGSITEELSPKQLRAALPKMELPRPLPDAVASSAQREAKTQVESALEKSSNEQIQAAAAAIGVESRSSRSIKPLLLARAETDAAGVLAELRKAMAEKPARAESADIEAAAVAMRKRRSVLKSLLECMSA